MTQRLLPLFLIGFLAACVAAGVAADEPPIVLEARPGEATSRLLESLVEASRSDYRIGRQDLLEISVFDVDELDQTVRVADDGSITMPLLGRLTVAGLTKTELEADDRRPARAELHSRPAGHGVRQGIRVEEGRGQRGGQAARKLRDAGPENAAGDDLDGRWPGHRPRQGDHHLPAGRERRDAARPGEPRASGLRRRPGAQSRSQLPGDIIYVPTVQKTRIFVSGAVKNPDLYEIPRDEPVTVLKAITLAGGTTDRAAEKRIQIMRTDADGQRISLMVNLRKVKRGKDEDPILQKDDIVLVPEGFF